MRQINPQNSQRRAPLPRGLHNPVAVERQRGDAGQAATTGAAIRPGRPADDTDDHWTALPVLEYRAAGIPGTGAEPVSRAARERIDQPDLQRPRFAGRDRAGGANDPATTALAADGDADAGDGEA